MILVGPPGGQRNVLIACVRPVRCNALHKVPSNPDICLSLRHQGREFHAKLGFFKNAKFTMRWAPVKTHCCGYYGLKNMVTGHRLSKLADFFWTRDILMTSQVSRHFRKNTEMYPEHSQTARRVW